MNNDKICYIETNIKTIVIGQNIKDETRIYIHVVM